MKYEYIEDDPETWQVFTPPPKDKAFERELLLIAGKTGDKPNLRLVWGGTEKDDRTEHKTQLKYHCGYTVPKTVGFKYLENGEEFFAEEVEDIPSHILGVVPVIKQQALGLPRWIIERFTSPDEIKKKNRFTNRADGTGFKILRDFPREGLYETWLIIDTKDHLYRDVGADILPFIRHKWKTEQLPVEEQNKLHEAWLERQERERAIQAEEAWMWAMDHDTKLPDDERERREFLERKLREKEEYERRTAENVSVYQSTI